MPDEFGTFIVDLITSEGRVCERYVTLAEARRRVEQFAADSVLSAPHIFEELADGSQRLVRDDGKPIQYHRQLVEESRESAEEPLALTEDVSSVVGPDGKLLISEPQPLKDDWDDLPLADLPDSPP
jgi:hypothetical protein